MIFKLISILLPIIIYFFSFGNSNAATNSFVTIVNPIRGDDFWEDQSQKPSLAVSSEMDILRLKNFSASWLIRFDGLKDKEIISILNSAPKGHDIGLFLEVTPSWTSNAGVSYRESAAWHLAESVFLTGYEVGQREKLIDSAFEEFKKTFGYFPKSVGAWWIDSHSLDYMSKKYKITSALIVADQYTTDNYQIWGQYFATPYYPSNKNTLIPAQEKTNKIPIVVMQWASRDPVNGYGNGVAESTYSLQANDYIDYHDLNTDYFSHLIDIFTLQKFNQFNQVVVGLENSYSWEDYGQEFRRQIDSLSEKQTKGQLEIMNMRDFSAWYRNKFPDISPEHIIVSDDPLGGEKKSVWYMNPYYRAGWFYTGSSIFRDLRSYIAGSEEPCLRRVCTELNFATSATRVLDDVSFGQNWLLDEGQISKFKVYKDKNIKMAYENMFGREKVVEFLERDISLDGEIKAIDTIILEAVTKFKNSSVQNIKEDPNLRGSFPELFLNLFKFLFFCLIVLLIPGYLLIRNLDETIIAKIFLSISISFCLVVLMVYSLGILFGQKMYLFIGGAFLLTTIFFLIKKCFMDFVSISSVKIIKENYLVLIIVILGTIFQTLLMAKSGWLYSFGVGYLGPTARDGIWHQALINQLTKQIPPINPGLSGEILSNYHYFYDLLVALTFKLTGISILDLVYRFYPILFSAVLGVGSYIFTQKLFKNKNASLLSLYFVYFGSSFGWIVEFLRERHFGGESAFWANQAVSMNLNPPFAISLVIFLAGLYLFHKVARQKNQILPLIISLVILWGTLIGFKAYGGVVTLGALFLVSLYQLLFKRSWTIAKIFLPTLILSLIIFLPQTNLVGGLLVFSPFWIIHSMVDLADRVGWQRLSLARQSIEQGQWLKFLTAEILGLLIFIIGNLGIKFISLFSLISFLKDKLWNNITFLFIFCCSLISVMMPILFIQKGNSWNTIQFIYYFMFLMAFIAGAVLATLIKPLSKRIKIIVLILIILLNPISSFLTFRSSFEGNPPATLTPGELEALTFLSNLEEGTVLSVPFDKSLRSRFTNPFPLSVYDNTAYVSAFSGKATFIEDETQQEILYPNQDGNQYKKRLIMARDFFYSGNLKSQEKFLSENNIRYIYIPKIHQILINTDKLKLSKVFENDETIILSK